MAMMASPSTTWPRLVHHDHPVGVAVQRDAQVGPVLHHLAGHLLGVQRAAAVVDVVAVGLDAERDDLRPQLLEDRRAPCW